MLNNTLTSLAPYPMRRAAPRHPHTLCHKLCHQDKRKNPSTLYGKLRKTGIVNYDENKSGAEIRDARLLSRLLTEDVEILLNEGATAYKKDGRTRTKLTKRNRGQPKFRFRLQQPPQSHRSHHRNHRTFRFRGDCCSRRM